MELDRKTQETGDLESKLNMARKLLDLEKNTRKVEADKTILESHLMKVRDVLLKDIITNLPDNTMQELHFLNIGGKSFEPLNTIQEGNTTGNCSLNITYFISVTAQRMYLTLLS